MNVKECDERTERSQDEFVTTLLVGREPVGALVGSCRGSCVSSPDWSIPARRKYMNIQKLTDRDTPGHHSGMAGQTNMESVLGLLCVGNALRN